MFSGANNAVNPSPNPLRSGMRKPNRIWLPVILAACFLSACATNGQMSPSSVPSTGIDNGAVPVIQVPDTVSDDTALLLAQAAPSGDEPAKAELFIGDGDFIDTDAAQRNAWTSGGTDGDIVLNFEGSDIREVVKTMLGDMLGVNYVIDPAVSGQVTLATSRPMSREQVLPTLEALLRMSGAVIKESDGIYSVVPASKAFSGALSPQLELTRRRGFQLLLIPLEFVSASQMQSILEPMLPESSIRKVDAARNLLIVGGARKELQQAQATVRVFDVDQMKGMSIGLFRMQNAEADAVSNELQAIFGTESGGPLAEMIQFMTIKRLNALVVMSKQGDYLDEARDWIERLDRADESSGQNTYVYPVQNGRAENLAGLLSELFGDGSSSQQSGLRSGSGARSPSPRNPANGDAQGGVVSAGGNNAGSSVGEIRIIADQENNALIINATRADYAKLKAALRRLDVMPLQVLVEATIVEVTLTDELSYGLQWFFDHTVEGKGQGVGELFPLPVVPSFSYSFRDTGGDVRAVLNLLAADSRLNVISSPSLMVLDNRTATIKVGDQVPIRTSETTSLATSGTDPLITSTIQYRDTGVLLEVTPRVNPGGMVMLEITQDVNDVDNTTTSSIDSPTIIQRRISTSVAVQSGESVVLGGLIRDNESESESGIPFLGKIPYFGRLFSSKTTKNTRTELLVLITPTAISNLAEARDATREMKKKLAGIDFGD